MAAYDVLISGCYPGHESKGAGLQRQGAPRHAPGCSLDVFGKPSNGLQVVTSQQTFQTGQASLTVSTAQVPTSGSLLIELASPTTAAAGYDGVAGLDTFQLVAKDWVGLQGQQLQYEFRYTQVLHPSNCTLAFYRDLARHLLQRKSVYNSTASTCAAEAYVMWTGRLGLDNGSPAKSARPFCCVSTGSSNCTAQELNGSTSPEQPLASPTVSNSISTQLPAGQVTVVLYARYFDSAATSPLGLPAGARLQSPALNIQPLLDPQAGRRRLLQGSTGPACTQHLESDVVTERSHPGSWLLSPQQAHSLC